MKFKERGLVYKTSRVSYIENYVIIILLLVFFYLLWPYLNIDFLRAFYSKNPADLLPLFLTLSIIPIITFFLEEPVIEQWIRQYLLTKNEVVKIEGIFRKKRIAIPYNNISDVRLDKGILGRIFNFGNVIVSGFKTEIVMKGIRNPDEVYRIINYRIRQRIIPRIKKREKVEEEEKL
ncbi:MAG: PH domain-containing protein [Candidatus Aenigmatarchaeota archaeon]